MSPSSAFQRFARELRRRHVPQTAAVYLVAAWAAIQFADVVVPNLKGPQWVVTAVIVAALVGFPVVLVLAWVFEWGPEGIHRTGDEPGLEAGPGATEPGGANARASSTPVVAAVGVLVVGIGTAVAVAALVTGGGDEPAGDGTEAVSDMPRLPDGPRRAPGERPELWAPGHADSLEERVHRRLGDIERLPDMGRIEALVDAATRLDSLDMGDFVDVATTMAEESGLSVFIREPRQWRLDQRIPAPLSLGDTLRVNGMAWDSAGVEAVRLNGTVVAERENAAGAPGLGFSGAVVGTGRSGTREIEILVRTADGREIRRTYPVIQRPARSP